MYESVYDDIVIHNNIRPGNHIYIGSQAKPGLIYTVLSLTFLFRYMGWKTMFDDELLNNVTVKGKLLVSYIYKYK